MPFCLILDIFLDVAAGGVYEQHVLGAEVAIPVLSAGDCENARPVCQKSEAVADPERGAAGPVLVPEAEGAAALVADQRSAVLRDNDRRPGELRQS